MLAQAVIEDDLVERYCAGMITEFFDSDRTRTDCISDTRAIEVDFSQMGRIHRPGPPL